jgi:hypothetical protein
LPGSGAICGAGAAQVRSKKLSADATNSPKKKAPAGCWVANLARA